MRGVMLDELAGAIEAACEAEPDSLGHGESMLLLLRLQTRLGATVARAAAAFDRSGEWRANGARSAASWLAARTHLPRESVARQVRLGRAVRDMPRTEQAWLAGDISDDHVA